MEEIKAYILSVTAVSLICGILNSLAGKSGTVSSVTRLLSGLCLALAVIQPAMNFSLADLEGYMGTIDTDAMSAVWHGENMAHAELQSIIKAKTEAYILDKANILGVDLEVEVIMSDATPPLPEGAILTGAISPYTKAQLETYLEKELGLPREVQQWTG